MTPPRQLENTRGKILEAALELFHTCTFNGTSINQIVERAGITKGALFHYFQGKKELGYAVVEEPLREEICSAWLRPLQGSTDPIADINAILEGFASEMVRDPEVAKLGCPLNNLAQEMSNIDDTFRRKLSALYDDWQKAIEKALQAGIETGTVRADVDPRAISYTLLAMIEGAMGAVKLHGDLSLLQPLGEGARYFLDSLKPR